MSPSGLASCAEKSDGDIGLHPQKRSRLWLWFVAAFLLQLGAWTAWFTIAAQHKVEEVPLVRNEKR